MAPKQKKYRIDEEKHHYVVYKYYVNAIIDWYYVAEFVNKSDAQLFIKAKKEDNNG